MNISVGPSNFDRTISYVAIFVLIMTLIVVLELLRNIVPDLNTLVMYLAPQCFGLIVMSYVIVVSREAVEEAKRKEESLLASQERFEYLYVSSPVPYINVNAEGEIFLVNLAAIRLFETTEQKVLGKSLYEYFDHESETKLSIIINQLQNQLALSDVELQLKTFTGKTKWILLSAFAYGKDKEQLVSLVDISRQKEVDMAKTEFVTLASHQLRTPIASMRWNFELLSQEWKEVTKDEQRYADRVARNIERLIALVNDFLHVSKLELGTFATDPKPTDLEAFIRDIAEEFEKSINEKELTLTYDFEPKHCRGEFDQRLLRIIIANLISNAVKYTPAKGTVTVAYTEDGDTVRVMVKDTGIGVPQAEVSKLFNRFYRATNAQEQHVEGTGLGLYIVKQAVEKLGGSIKVTSVAGEGSTFEFTLPT